jgi:hypothetical protein
VVGDDCWGGGGGGEGLKVLRMISERLFTWQVMSWVCPAVQMGILPCGPSFEKSHTVFLIPPC